MPFATEVYFDAESTALVTRTWARLAERGVSRSMLKDGYRPHWSFAVSDGIDLPALVSALDPFVATWEALEVTLSTIGMFPTEESVLFYGVTVTAALNDLHRRFFAIFEAHASGVWEYYRPGAWVPHCTLAYGLRPGEMGAALEVARETALPVRCKVVETAVVEVTARYCRPLRSWPVR